MLRFRHAPCVRPFFVSNAPQPGLSDGLNDGLTDAPGYATCFLPDFAVKGEKKRFLALERILKVAKQRHSNPPPFLPSL